MKLENHIKTLTGLEYTFLSMDENNVGSFKLRNAIRKFRITYYNGVEAAANMDGVKFVSGKRESFYDAEIDGIKGEKEVYFNVNGESYVNLFKRHKEEKERKAKQNSQTKEA